MAAWAGHPQPGPARPGPSRPVPPIADDELVNTVWVRNTCFTGIFLTSYLHDRNGTLPITIALYGNTSLPQPSLTTLATFAATGTHPYGALVEDAAGNLYGTTGLSPTDKGANASSEGTVFELVKGATTITTLATFSGPNGTDPVAGLTIDAAGNLFGATAYGGTAGDGTLFELVKGAKAVTTLATFNGANGAVPQSLLTADAAGNLFGVTNSGGSNNVGTVFELVKGATAVTTLASFTGNNGAFGEGGVTVDAAGNIYGTTVYGGTTGPGTIFELAKGAKTVTTLVNFTGPNGSTARSGLTADAAGNLYGVTFKGGSADDGTIYELAKGAKTVATLATFTGSNGANPIGNLTIDAAGNLFGTASAGGTGGAGTVFELLKGASVISTLATFTAAVGNPYAGLTVDAAGNLFGTTSSGNGTVFEIAAATAFVPLKVVTSSPDTTALLATVNLAASHLPAAAIYTDNGGAIPAAPVAGSALLLTSTLTGNIAIPTGYGLVELASGSAVNLTGGDANTMIIGDGFTYNGTAAWVGSGDGVSQITDNAAGATILLGSTGSNVVTAGGTGATVSVGNSGTSAATLSGAGASFATGSNSHFALTASGSNQKIEIGNGALGTALVSGAADVIDIGGNSVAPAGTAPATGFTTKINGSAGHGSTYNITDADSRNLLALGNADAVNVAAGASTIFGLTGDTVTAGAGQLEFVGGGGISTVVGGAANVVMFATSGQVFDVGSAQANVFVGGTAASTINAGAGGGSFFGGTAGERYNFGTGHAQVFVGTGGSDTLSGGAGAVAPVIFASGAEKLTIADVGGPVTVVSFAAGGVIDASQTAGNNNFFAGYGSLGNQTLVGATTGADTFVIGANPSATATSITIDNWHGGDVFYLTGFTAADTATMDGAVAGSLAQGAVGDLSFTLADNTTITFVGQHPTNFDGAGAAF